MIAPVSRCCLWHGAQMRWHHSADSGSTGCNVDVCKESYQEGNIYYGNLQNNLWVRWLWSFDVLVPRTSEQPAIFSMQSRCVNAQEHLPCKVRSVSQTVLRGHQKQIFRFRVCKAKTVCVYSDAFKCFFECFWCNAIPNSKASIYDCFLFGRDTWHSDPSSDRNRCYGVECSTEVLLHMDLCHPTGVCKALYISLFIIYRIMLQVPGISCLKYHALCNGRPQMQRVLKGNWKLNELQEVQKLG